MLNTENGVVLHLTKRKIWMFFWCFHGGTFPSAENFSANSKRESTKKGEECRVALLLWIPVSFSPVRNTWFCSWHFNFTQPYQVMTMGFVHNCKNLRQQLERNRPQIHIHLTAWLKEQWMTAKCGSVHPNHQGPSTKHQGVWVHRPTLRYHLLFLLE